MILVVHIAVALASIAAAGYSLFSPSNAKLRTSYALTGLTLATGTYLVITLHANLVRACMTGLLYLAVVMGLIFLTHRRLAMQKSKQE